MSGTSYAKLPRKVHGRGRPSSRYGGTPGHGRRQSEDGPVEKALGSWKTIEQREQHQRRDKKVRGYGVGATTAGAGLTGAVIQHGRQRGRNAVEDAHAVVHPGRGYVYHSALGSVRNMGDMRPLERAVALPHGAGVLAGGGLMAAGLATAAGATGMKAYHQRRINQRRRANAGRGSKIKKADFTPTSVLSRTKPIAQIAADGGAGFGPGHQAAQAVQTAKPAGTSAGAAGRTNALAGKLTGLQAQKPITGQAGTANGKGLASMGAQKPQQPVQSMGSIGSMSKAADLRLVTDAPKELRSAQLRRLAPKAAGAGLIATTSFGAGSRMGRWEGGVAQRSMDQREMNRKGKLSKAQALPAVVRTRRRSHDPERGRQFRLGAATAGTAAGGGALVVSGGRELRRLNRTEGHVIHALEHTKLVNRKGGGRSAVGIAGLIGAGQLARYASSNSNRRWT